MNKFDGLFLMMKRREKPNVFQKEYGLNVNLCCKLVATTEATTILIEARSVDIFPLHNSQREKLRKKNIVDFFF